MDLSEQPRTGAAQRRKQRRLRSWWRHEQQSIAAALATSLHHSSRGQRKARAGEEENEMHYTDKDRKTPPPSRCSSACTKKSPAGGGLPAWQSRRGPRSGYSDTPWSSLPTSLPWCPLFLYLSRRWWTSWWPWSSTSILWCPSRLSQCPRSPGHPAFLVRFSVSRRRRNSWWKCLSLPPPSATGSAGRRPTGARVRRGLVASIGA